MFFQLLFCALVPYSALAEQFFSDGRYTLIQREKKRKLNITSNNLSMLLRWFSFLFSVFSILITVGLFTFVAGWFLSVALATYQYFDYMSIRKTRRAGRANNEQARDTILFRATLNTNYI